MDFISLAKKRCSVRTYSDCNIPEERLERVLTAASLAPSAVNYQPWKMLIVRNNEGKQKMQAIYKRDWFATASCYIAVCADTSAAWNRASDGKNHAEIDATLLLDHLCLAAAEEGLGTCIVCNFDPEEFRKAFNMPLEMEVIAIVSIGYPADKDIFKKTAKKRKAVEEIVCYEEF